MARPGGAGIVRRATLGGALVAAATLASACGGGGGQASTATTSSPTVPVPPSSVSADTTTVRAPAGLPSNWSTRAIQAAQTALETCATSTTLNPQNCPQQNQGQTYAGDIESIQWSLVGAPMAGAAAVPSDASQGGTPGQVDVYGRYLMDVSYGLSGGNIRPVLDYSGGMAHASMNWDGSSFQNVQFLGQPQNSPPPGVTVPPFPRPEQVTDAMAIAAVKDGFTACAKISVPLTNFNIPNCPMGIDTPLDAISAQWSLQGDPTSGAIVSFDTNHGVFAVTGSYQMQIHYVVNVAGDPGAFNNGPHTGPANGNYTATLIWDGQQLHLLNIVTA